MSGARRRLADNLAAQSIPEDPEYISDPFSRGVADALQRRGIVTVPGMKTAAEIAHDAHRQRVKDVVAALTPQPPAPPPEPEPERQSLAQQIKAMIGQPSGEIPLNGQRLLDHAADQLNPGGSSAPTDGQSSAGGSTT